ncbi:DUF5666 domain-containing protein [Limnohabitans sp.]|uniref:DUF5666 domain-containing protein n=1 Tax=Limnohabitans sp. TaxID=1907725 RepID=UPI00286FA065|nr:DUF5666 domain-containing protein [Limnohabitans sp.]
MKKLKLNTFWSATAGVLISLLLQGCGGGSGTSSQATSGAQIANGVVTGFGSVFVDGVEIEDANARVVTENYDGTFSNSVLQMGQRVRVAHDGKGTASTVTLDAAVVGLVSAVDATNKTLTVAGQKVSVTTDSTVGTLTVWGGGYSSISDVVAPTDLVEVHGTPVYDSTNKTYTVSATRIQKLTADTGRMQVAGTISKLDTTVKTFVINGLTVNYTTAALRPANAALADGTVVTVYGPLTALSGNTLTASHIKVNRLQDSTLSVSNAQIGGQVSKYDSTANTFEIQGIKVTIGSDTTTNPKGKAVANGAYVKVSGTVGSDGSLTATNIQVREQNTNSDLATVKLIGVISDYVSKDSFVVRGVPVDASGIDLAASCPNITLANGQEVQVTATQQASTPVVYATQLSCKAQAAVVIRPVDGAASGVNTSSKTFTLTLTGSTTTQAVQWNDATTFVGVTIASLENKSVRVEGYMSGSTLVARVISAVSGNALDDHAFRQPSGSTSNTSTTASNAWNSYRSKHKH